MRRLNEQADALFAGLHRCMLAVFACEGLLFAVVFLFTGVLNTDVFLSHRNLVEPLTDYFLMPWCGVLLGSYLVREKQLAGMDIRALVLLILWLAVPFILRFGTEYFTMRAVFGYSVCFFVFYASVRAGDARRRARILDAACAGICLISICVGGMLLYCAWTGKVFQSYPDTWGFGVSIEGFLNHSTNWNITGMLALACTLICLVGLTRSIRKPYAVLYGLGMVIMALVVVLTQCRTVRYAMLAVFALGAWNGLSEYLAIRNRWLRQAAALACSLVVLVGGYWLCARITDAALAHYAGVPFSIEEAVIPSAFAEDNVTTTREEALQVREPTDSNFNYRTVIWGNAVASWKENPKHFLIGNGLGRTKWLLARGEVADLGVVETHNAYLFFICEFGLIGFILLVVFLLCAVRPVLRVFFAHGDQRMPGGCALCMLVVAILLTGMMENEPLEPLTPMSIALFFALGHLVSAGCEMKLS